MGFTVSVCLCSVIVRVRVRLDKSYLQPESSGNDFYQFSDGKILILQVSSYCSDWSVNLS